MPNGKGKGGGEFAPTEEQILSELKQREQRKSYMKSPKAVANRQKYQEKKKAAAKAMREYLKNNPAIEERMRADHPEIFAG